MNRGYMPVNMTVDLLTVISGWAVRTLWSSGLAGRGFAIATSMDAKEWTMLKEYTDNEDRVVS